MAVVSLRKAAAGAPPPPNTTPERETLAERIAARDRAADRLAGLRSVLDRGDHNVWDARTALDSATTAIDFAAKADARAATDALIAGTSTPRPTLSAARLAVQEATDALEAANFARDAIRSEIGDLERGANMREMFVDDAAVAVLRAESTEAVTALIAEIDALHRLVVAKGLALRALILSGVVQDRGPAAIFGASEMNSRLTNAPVSWSIANVPAARVLAEQWKADLAALKSDASAPLPVGGA